MAKKALYWLGYFFRSKIVFFKKKKICISGVSLSTCICTMCVKVLLEARKGHQLPWNWSSNQLWSTWFEYWELSSSSLQEQQALLISHPSSLTIKKQCKHFQSTHSVWQILGTFFHSKICLLTILLPSLSMLLASPVQYSLQDNVHAIISSSQQQIFWIDILKTKVYTYTNNPWESNTKHLLNKLFELMKSLLFQKVLTDLHSYPLCSWRSLNTAQHSGCRPLTLRAFIRQSCKLIPLRTLTCKKITFSTNTGYGATCKDEHWNTYTHL